MVAHWNLKPARLPIPPDPRKKQATELIFSGSWCEKRDLNPYGKTTRPSNVRVYQFRHSRFSCAWDFGLHRCALATVSIIPHLSRNVNTFFQISSKNLSILFLLGDTAPRPRPRDVVPWEFRSSKYKLITLRV